jgi:hypothetical protein|tara:strand:+ start:1638 stop:2075 length:438 start_codon:yes stop_codon:yes gene_type:complete
VKNKELSNQFLDISEDILDKLKIGNFSDTKNNQLLFLVCIENSLMYLANDIFDTFQNELKPIKDLNYKSKWLEISNVMALKNIIFKELDSDGVINQIEKSKNIIFRENDENLITRSETNDLKKFILILDKYKAFQEILRKTLYEC